MTPEQVELVQTTFAKVAPISATAAKLFYDRLFEIDPDVRPFFKTDLTIQGQKLMTTLGVVVYNLNKPDVLMPAAEELALRHVSYGVLPEHYKPVGEALLWTLEQGLGEAFTEDAKEAWATAYSALSTAMISAAYPTHETAE